MNKNLAVAAFLVTISAVSVAQSKSAEWLKPTSKNLKIGLFTIPKTASDSDFADSKTVKTKDGKRWVVANEVGSGRYVYVVGIYRKAGEDSWGLEWIGRQIFSWGSPLQGLALAKDEKSVILTDPDGKDIAVKLPRSPRR